MSVKINTFEMENVKKIKAVQLTPTENGLTVIGGKNRQGKTSVLDAIAWALGGNKFKPSEPHREGSVSDPHLKVTLSNGITVERSGKSSSLKVIDSKGNKGGQALLDSFIESFALDLPKFMQASAKDKADTLLKIIGVGDKLYELERREKELYEQRHTLGQIGEQKAKYAAELEVFPGVPDEPVSASELIAQQQEILRRNAENERLRQNSIRIQAERNALNEKLEALKSELEKCSEQLRVKMEELEIARKTAAELKDESTSELEANIAEIDELNRKVRINQEKHRAEAEAEEYREKYRQFTEDIENVRKERMSLLEGADLPLAGLSVSEGELTYNGHKWDGMSGAEQLVVATSIVRRLNPECGFVLLDKLEQMDTDTLREFGEWLEKENLQAIATRVSVGDECSVIIEDGESKLPGKPEYKGFGAWNGGTI